MEFGKLQETELAQASLSLPDDPSQNRVILKKGVAKTKFYIGCAKWGRKDWIGTLYPQGTKEKDFLSLYARQFNSIEFNAFFYRKRTREQVEEWVAAVPKGFLFCPKFNQSVTHYRRLNDTRELVDDFLNVIDAFGKHLGPLLLEPHPQMGVNKFDTITHFLDDLPADLDVFIELRHESWFSNGFNDAMNAYLRKHRRGAVITDAAGRRDCVHMHLTKPECFIRFVGNGLHHTDYMRIDDWVQRLKTWMDYGLRRCYFFMHQHEERHSPDLLNYFIDQMNKHAGTSIPLPTMYQ